MFFFVFFFIKNARITFYLCKCFISLIPKSITVILVAQSTFLSLSRSAIQSFLKGHLNNTDIFYDGHNSAHQKIWGLVQMTFGLVNASISLPNWQAVKMIFFAPWSLSFFRFYTVTQVSVQWTNLQEQLGMVLTASSREGVVCAQKQRIQNPKIKLDHNWKLQRQLLLPKQHVKIT